MDDTRAAVDRLRRGEHLVGHGRGEDLTGTGRIEHSAADEPAVERLVTRAAAGDEGDLALDRRVFPEHDLVVEVDAQQLAVRGREAGERLLDDVVWCVDELLHGDGCNAHRSLLST